MDLKPLIKKSVSKKNLEQDDLITLSLNYNGVSSRPWHCLGLLKRKEAQSLTQAYEAEHFTLCLCFLEHQFNNLRPLQIISLGHYRTIKLGTL